VCNGNLLRPEKDITMSTKISLALAALVIACASPALAGGDGNRDNWYAACRVDWIAGPRGSRAPTIGLRSFRDALQHRRISCADVSLLLTA
jgi:hypothetical protein